MKRPPLILISPNTEKKGDEFGDTSLSLAETYQRAVLGVGGVPVAMPCTIAPEAILECVRRSDGVILTGGDDVAPALYTRHLPAKVRKTVSAPDLERDLREILLIHEVFRQRKPLLAICRGQQILNVAFGGTLIADLPLQLGGPIIHRQPKRKAQVVHSVKLTERCLLAKITGKQTLGVNSTHHQAVARVAGPFQCVATSEDGVVEAMELKPDNVQLLPFLMSVQFHPERLVDRYPEHAAIFQAFVTACMLNRENNL